MLRKLLCVLSVVGFSCVLLPAAQTTVESSGVINATGKWWRVTYTENGPSNAFAVLLRIRPDAGGATNELDGKLILYRATKMVGTKTVYDRDSRHIATLEGKIETNPGANDDRRLQRFILCGTYDDAAGVSHDITVRGFHYTGKHKGKSGDKDKKRDDDQLIVRIKEIPCPDDADATKPNAKKTAKKSTPKASKPAPKSAPPFLDECDDDPPDEDVLTEEVVNDDDDPADPDYDG